MLIPGTTFAIIGLPGSGKTTLSERLAAHVGAPRLSTGEAVRSVARTDDALAAKLAGGDLAPEQLVLDVVHAFLSRTSREPIRILDGFPRHVAQADLLIQTCASVRISILEVDEATAISRLVNARARSDDTPEVLSRRMARERTAIAEIAKRYANIALHLRADDDSDSVFMRLVTATALDGK